MGGGRHTWDALGRSSGVTILNLLLPKDPGGFNYVRASGCNIPLPDKSFDRAFSNSAIEHVGSEENQFKFASEMIRVGKRIYCQTPSRLFPIDPHLTVPFLHWLPTSADSKVSAVFHVEWMVTGEAISIQRNLDLQKELKKMFPGCKITTERFLLMPKSFTVTN